jgi:hypothetical protein
VIDAKTRRHRSSIATAIVAMATIESVAAERLGLTHGCRVACVARVHGPVTLVPYTEDFVPGTLRKERP